MALTLAQAIRAKQTNAASSGAEDPTAIDGDAAAATKSKKWESERERSRANQAKKSADGRDIGQLPPIANTKRKEDAGQSFELFCRAYHPHVFNLPWSTDHREAIEIIETIVPVGGQLAYAMPRGSGKTSLAEAAVLWAALYGYRLFPLVIGSDATSAEEILDSIKKELAGNDELLADFPEVCYPIRRIEGIAHRCAGQTHLGKRTQMEWGAQGIVLPTIDGSKASGCVIGVAGLTGRLRGMKFKRPDGQSVRPDLVILDDPQTDESARSPSQCATRKRLVNGAVLGLAGPGKEIAALMPCTVVAPGDLSDELLDREKNPDWRGKRTKMVKSWPTNQKLWDEYAELRAADLRAGGDGSAATEFYRANREAMDEGGAVSWPARKSDGELSGLQHAINLRLKRGDVAFFAEYQNEPLVETEGEEMLTAGEIAKKTNGIKKSVVPIGRDHITAFIDVQGGLLYYLVCAWGQNFTGDIVEYGAWPDQKAEYFTVRDARRTFTKLFKGKGQEAQIYAALEALTDELLSRVWVRDDGAEMRISRCPIDANWGESTETVYQFCRQSKWAGVVMPSHGRYVGASSKPWEQYKLQPGELIGNHWMIPSIKGKRAVRHLLIDTNWWKSFVHQRLAVSMGDPGCLALYKPDNRTAAANLQNEPHRMLSEHLTAEYRVKTSGNGRTVDEWKARPGKPDNHFLDCLVGSAVAASLCGCAIRTKPKGAPPPGSAAAAAAANAAAGAKKGKKRAKVTYL